MSTGFVTVQDLPVRPCTNLVSQGVAYTVVAVHNTSVQQVFGFQCLSVWIQESSGSSTAGEERTGCHPDEKLHACVEYVFFFPNCWRELFRNDCRSSWTVMIWCRRHSPLTASSTVQRQQSRKCTAICYSLLMKAKCQPCVCLTWGLYLTLWSTIYVSSRRTVVLQWYGMVY